ncbi:hypothetical protein DOE78_18980 [Bacillus sp. Y1]|nr:hypothetical protein DOE78_18980 [Bacillus sp. Y1]
MDEETLRATRRKNAIERAKRAVDVRSPDDLSFQRTPSRATRASEIIANQPVVQEMVARQLGIRK